MNASQREVVTEEQCGSKEVYIACLSRGITESGRANGSIAGIVRTITDEEYDTPLQVDRDGAPLRDASSKAVGELAPSDVGECLTSAMPRHSGVEHASRVIQSPAVLALSG